MRDSFFNMALGTKVGDVVPDKYFYTATVGFALLSVLLALYLPTILIVCSLCGGLFGSLLCFILPSTFVLKLHYKGWRKAPRFAVAQMWFVFAFGMVTCVFGTYASMQHALDPKTH